MKSSDTTVFSIIVPVYNSQEFLHKCLDSLVNQTLHDIEIICIDDGSTDDSLSILREYANADNRVIVITQQNSGPSVARNKGLFIAKGKYILFVDSDDWLEYDACYILKYELIKNPVDIAIFRHATIENNIQKNGSLWDPFIRDYAETTICPKSHTNLISGHTTSCGKAINRQFLQQHNILFPNDVVCGEDICFFIDILLTANTLQFLDTNPLYIRNLDNKNSITHKRKHFLQIHLKRTYFCKQKILQSDLSDEQKLSFLLCVFNKSVSCACWEWSLSNQHDKKLEVNELEECIKTINNEAIATIGKPVPAYFKAVKNIAKFKHPLKRRLFSISREPGCTLIRLLWLRIKLRPNLNFFENILYLHNKDQKRKVLEVLGNPIYFRRHIFAIKNNFKLKKCHQYYTKHIKQLIKIKTKRRIRVGFLCNCTQKWKCQRLYDLLEQDTSFEPVILIAKPIAENHSSCYSKHNEYYNDTELVKEDTIKDANWFKSRGMHTEYVFDIDTLRYKHPEQWNIDVVFYQEPWTFESQLPVLHLAKYMLCCYVPYFVARGLPEYDYNKPFHNQLFRYYVPYEYLTQQYSYKMKTKGENLRTTGHPMLDIIHPAKHNDNGYVIYAPHWSLNKRTCRFSTFAWSGKYMLEFAQQHSSIKWCFKPHPRLHFQLQNQDIMTAKEVDNYYNAWNEIGISYEFGGYDKIFNNSRAMISDCGSFTTEYLLTEQPLIFLCSQESIDLNDVTSEVFKNYYHAHNIHELKQHLETVVLNHQDPLKEDRIINIAKFRLGDRNASEKIICDMKKTLKIS